MAATTGTTISRSFFLLSLEPRCGYVVIAVKSVFNIVVQVCHSMLRV